VDGRVLAGSDGERWTRHGRLPGTGRPTVFTAVSSRHLLAADNTDTVYTSTDAGATWTVLHQPSDSSLHH
jgi:photosystem II stability/assembly factor-like uncharacterized protein